MFGVSAAENAIFEAIRPDNDCVNIFGELFEGIRSVDSLMPAVDEYVTDTEAPTDRARETMDARDLPPPQPLQNTLERLVTMDDETVLVQVNDRVPQHLYPRLTDRGYEYETIEADPGVVTVIWMVDP
ncbi:DUF2249 domain-containing protein [Halococcus dombrowskii]|uniref:DUF2249 domain-containing protein n=1 Tax=Halococcus dombrowskii TaxID=179637 RepID=A0AAX3ANB8_HALDO|nr:DUF2249 domain-containing protein [Halococcus dombrowskii]UOO95702.1 DUF2249 domain-containing protein [Halococcus dombrowskii]